MINSNIRDSLLAALACGFSLSTSAVSTAPQQTTLQALSPALATQQYLKPVPTQFFRQQSIQTGHDYFIQVYVPPVAAPKEGYAVLYVLDGNASFDAIRALAPALLHGSERLGLTPVMVVAIGYASNDQFDVKKRALDYTPKPSDSFQQQQKHQHGGADQFSAYIEQSLKPSIAQQFKINPNQQSLYGHSLGGLFVLDSLFKGTTHFQRYIAASPSLWFNDFSLFQQQQNWLNQQVHNQDQAQNRQNNQTKSPPAQTMLMLSVGSKEQRGGVATAQQHTLASFSQQFHAQPRSNLQVWSFLHPAEQHITNLYASLPKALLLAGCKDPQTCDKLLNDGIE